MAVTSCAGANGFVTRMLFGTPSEAHLSAHRAFAQRSAERRTKGGGYFGGCSSLLSQPNTLSVLSGSGWSHSKHWNMRGPLPSEGDATKIRYAPHLGHLN